jgi:ketosteroid isomerase-like protein
MMEMTRTLKRTLAIAMIVMAPLALRAQETKSSDAPASSAVGQSDTSDIQQVMNSYHEAVASHDGAKLASLFLPDASLWLNVLTDRVYEHVKAEKPSASKIKVGNYQDFAKTVSTTTKNFDPHHTNLVIHTDGTIATVYFDYVFFVDGQAENRGSESWQLVKGADGWRIASIIYSSDPPIAQK